MISSHLMEHIVVSDSRHNNDRALVLFWSKLLLNYFSVPFNIENERLALNIL